MPKDNALHTNVPYSQAINRNNVLFVFHVCLLVTDMLLWRFVLVSTAQ
jgi:hypothetical protein